MKNLIVLTLLISSFAFGQKVKVKKDYIQFDKENIVKMEESSKGKYTIYNKEGSEALSVEYVGKKVGEKKFDWLIVNDLNADKSNEIDLEWTKIDFTLSIKTAIARQLSNVEGLITKEGIDNLAVKRFFEEKRISSAKATYEGNANAASANQATINDFNPYIAEDNLIYKGGANGTEIGRVLIDRLDNGFPNPNWIYKFYDLDNNQIATYKILNRDRAIEIINGKKIPFGISDRSISEARSYYKGNGFRYEYKEMPEYEILSQLILSGYVLEHHYKNDVMEQRKKQQEEKEEKIVEARKASINIYDQPGYVIDDKGEKLEGEISLVFEEIPEEKEQWGNVVDLDSKKMGQQVTVAYKNKKGKTKYKTFRSKDGVKVCFDNEECYIGYAVKGSAAGVVTGGLSSLNFDTSYFYKILDQKEHIGLYSRYYGDDEAYFLKLKSEKKGLEIYRNRLFDKGETDLAKNKEQLLDYLKDCKTIKEKIDTYDLTSKEGTIQIMNDYENCKK